MDQPVAQTCVLCRSAAFLCRLGRGRRLREGLTHFLHRKDEARLRLWESAWPRQMAADSDQQRKGDQEFHRSCKPKPIASPRVILSQNQGQQSRYDEAQRRLPQVIAQRWCAGRPYYRQVFQDHGLSFLASLRRVFSASFTSSSVSFPDSIKCAITGCVRPPNSASRSSISLRCAASREIAAAKM